MTMLVRGRNAERFDEGLVRLGRELENLARRNRTDQAVHAERLYLRLLNRLYGWELRSVDDESPSFEAIDLYDDCARVVVQVSVTRDRHKRDKVNATLAKDAMRGYAGAGYRLKLCFVGEQGDSVKSSGAIRNPYGVDFDPKADILLASDLLARFEALDLAAQAEALRILDEETGRIVGPPHADEETVARINARLERQRRDHPSFKLMSGFERENGIDERLLPKGRIAEQIPNSARTVVADGGEPVRFGEFIRASWESGGQCHLLVTGEGGIGKTVALLTIVTEEGFLPRSVAAVYVPLHELAQYCGNGEGADRDCVDRFVEKDFPGGKEALATLCELANRPWSGGPSLILLMDGYNEVPAERRRAVDDGVSKWASWPGVQVVTTSREVSLFGVPHMRRLELRPLSREAVGAYLGDDAPDESDGRLWRLLETPLMLRLYANAVEFGRDKRVKAAHYLRTIDEISAGGLVWNYLQWELFRCVEDRKGSHAEGAYATAIMLVAPYVCWRMEAASRFTVGWEELGDLVEEACRHWAGREKPAGSSRTLARILRWLDGKDPFDLASELRDVIVGEVALFVESGDAYSLPHQSFRDCLAAIHLKNVMEVCHDELPTVFSGAITEYVKDYLSELCEGDTLMRLWKVNAQVKSSDNATYNLIRIIHKKRNGDLSELTWTEMDLRGISLFPFRKGAELKLSPEPGSFQGTLLDVGCFTPEGHYGAIKSVSISPSGLLLASGSRDGSVCIWDLATGRRIGEPLREPGNQVLSVCFSNEGSMIAAGYDDGSICIWEATTKREVAALDRLHEGAVNSVCFSPDGSLLASASSDNSICVVDPKTQRVVSGMIGSRVKGVLSVCFSPDGKLLASGCGDRAVRLWDPKTGQRVGRPFRARAGRVWSVCFSPDGRRLASGHGDGSVRIWDVAMGQIACRPLRVCAGRVNSVSFSPDGKTIASGTDYCAIRLWDTVAGRLVTELRRLDWGADPSWGQVYSVCFTPDGRQLASGHGDGSIRLWDPVAGQTVREPLRRLDNWASSTCFSPDGRSIAQGSSDGMVRIWDLDTGDCVGRPLVTDGGRVWSVRFAPTEDDGWLATGSDDGMLRLWDLSGRERGCKAFKGDGGRMVSVCFSPDGKLLASGSIHGAAEIWDFRTGQRVASLNAGLWGMIWSVCFSPDGSLLAVGSSHGLLELFDPQTGRRVGAPLVGFGGRVRSICYSQDGRFIAGGSDTGVVQLWDLGTGKPKYVQLSGHRERVGSVCFSPDGALLASGSRDGTVLLWSPTDGRRVGISLVGGGWSVGFSPDGSMLTSSSSDGYIRLWRTREVVCAAPGSSVAPVRTIRALFGLDLHGCDFSQATIGSARDAEILRQNGAVV